MPADDAEELDSYELCGVLLNSWSTVEWLEDEPAGVVFGLND